MCLGVVLLALPVGATPAERVRRLVAVAVVAVSVLAGMVAPLDSSLHGADPASPTSSSWCGDFSRDSRPACTSRTPPSLTTGRGRNVWRRR